MDIIYYCKSFKDYNKIINYCLDKGYPVYFETVERNFEEDWEETEYKHVGLNSVGQVSGYKANTGKSVTLTEAKIWLRYFHEGNPDKLTRIGGELHTVKEVKKLEREKDYKEYLRLKKKHGFE